MQQDGSASAKQQIVERIKQSTNILITVSSNPSVDALSATLAFTLMLNKLDKHATAVFSGTVPPAIKFLDPGKTFEHNVDSLRDFIIALDKEKADRLRYKVENDVVKIFITPYKTTIAEKDLQFSQGDFNVDLIIALGVEKRDELDKAITAHGRILHDAVVTTINAANQKSSLGAIDWQDAAASSLCEMLMSLSEALQPGLLDQQVSTALLTGIVAATERFSNQRTSPRVMTMAAQLMAAGANQQLIATNLGATMPSYKPAVSPAEGSAKVKNSVPGETTKGEMHITHEAAPPQTARQAPPASQPQPAAPELELPVAQPAAEAFSDLKQALEEESKNATKPPVSAAFDNKSTATSSNQKATEPPKKDDDSYLTSKPSWMGRNIQPPTLGGTLNATAEEALESKMQEESDERNHKLLSHNQPKPKKPALPQTSKPEPPKPQATQQTPAPQPVAQPAMPAPPVSQPVMDALPLQTEPTLEQLEQQAKSNAKTDLDAARQAVDDAIAAQPFSPIGNPLESVGAQEFPAILQEPQPTPQPSQSTSPGLPLPAQQLPQAPQQGVMPPLPQLPPLPDFNTLPPQPQLPPLPDNPPAQSEPPKSAVPPPAKPADPGQFRIPGQ